MVRSTLPRLSAMVLLVGLLPTGGASAIAQQTTVQSPLSRSSQGFSENIGVQWGFRFPGGFFQFGGPPPVGAANGARGGSSWGSGDTGGYFNWYAGQSSHSGFSGGSSSVTLGNGQSGGLFEGRQVPFVLGVVPVVGDFAGGAGVPYRTSSAFQDRVERLRAEGVDLTAPRKDRDEGELASDTPEAPLGAAGAVAPAGVIPPPAGSVEAIARAKAAADAAQQAQTSQEIDALLAKANQAVEAGKSGLARVYLQMALRRSTGEQQAEVTKRLLTLSP